VPANIGLVAGAKSPEMGKRFIQYTLSPAGQELLLDPKISRLPVLPETYRKAPAGFPDPYGGKIKAKVNFDSNASERRYYLVSSLFDQTITFRLKELQAATRAIQAAESKLAASGKPNPQSADLIRQARDLAYTPVVTASLASQPDFLKLFASNKKEVAVSKQITGLEESWNRKARENYTKAAELAQQAAGLIK
jgi:hypothetical protein